MPDLQHAQDRLDWLAKFNETERQLFEGLLNRLIMDAKRCGVILTIDMVPTRPLAMGNYMVVGKAHLARPAYQEQMALEKRVEELRDGRQ